MAKKIKTQGDSQSQIEVVKQNIKDMQKAIDSLMETSGINNLQIQLDEQKALLAELKA